MSPGVGMIAGTALSLAAGAALGREAPPSPSPLPGRVTASVAGEPDWLTTGQGALWLVSYTPGALHRIDPVSGRVVATVPTGGRACHRALVAYGRVWTVDCTAGLLLGLDPRRGVVDRRWPLPLDPKREGALAAAGGDLWVSVAPSSVARVDPASGRIKATIPLPAGASAVASGLGSVWVSCTDAGVVARIDPRTNRVLATIPVGPRPKFLAVGAGSVWAMHLKNASVTRINPRRNAVAAEIATGTPETGGGDIAFGARAVWLPVEGRPLTRIDPRTNAVTHSFTGGQSTAALTLAYGAIWISDYDRGELWKTPLNAIRPSR